MAGLPRQGLWRRLLWSWRPESVGEARRAVVRNFLLHWFPARVSRRSLAYGYSFYLGAISFALFAILTVSGVALMCHYVPSVERAYWTMKDIDFAVSFGWFLRRVHRVGAHTMVVSVLLHMLRVYTKAPGKKADMADPYVLPVGSTVLDLGKHVHKELAASMKSARVWGGAKFDGQYVGRDYVLQDRDVVELHE